MHVGMQGEIMMTISSYIYIILDIFFHLNKGTKHFRYIFILTVFVLLLRCVSKTLSFLIQVSGIVAMATRERERDPYATFVVWIGGLDLLH